VRFAADAGLLTKEQALATIDPDRLDALLHPPSTGDATVLARGVAASPGAGFDAAKGILISEGGKASHAALVARGMGVPAVTGARIEATDDLDELERLLARTEAISEENPMLGTRGCRLGILYPEIYEMQVHAIMRAAKAMREPPRLEIMIPLVDYEQEIEIVRTLVARVGDEEGLRAGADYTVGTMIELPRACFVANRIAEHADFFSFGTNDLTQTALGFSRDDVESKFVPVYMERKIIDRSAFETIDKPGVGWLVRLAAWVGREARPDLKLGICGEHGGAPESIEFFHMAGLDYVSCSPRRRAGDRAHRAARCGKGT
jgi:pyruvate,orthophosphate dikinase